MIIRFLIFVLLIYILYQIMKGIRQLKQGRAGDDRSRPAGEDLVEDPVCHTYIPVSQAYKIEISGRNHYFCSKECGDKYTSGKNN